MNILVLLPKEIIYSTYFKFEKGLIFGQVASYIVITMTWPPLGGDYCCMILGVLQVRMRRQVPNYGEVVHTSLRVQAPLEGGKSPMSRCLEAVDWII